MRTKKPSQLMKQMGSRTGQFDPEPPDQWRYVLRHGRGEEQALAWIKSKTVARDHDSPFAIDANTRNPLKVEAMATDLGWALQTAKNVLRSLEAQGRARTDDEGRIWLCADVPSAYAEPEPPNDSETEQPDSWENFVQSFFSGYLADSIRGLSAELRPAFQTRYSAFSKEFKPRVLREAVAVARAITDQCEDTILAEFGVKRRRQGDTGGPVPTFDRVQKVIGEFNSVQSFNGHANDNSVQSEKPGLYKAETGSVQNGASLLLPDPDPDIDREQPAAAKRSGCSGQPQETPPPPPAPSSTEPEPTPQHAIVKSVSVEQVHAALQSHDRTVTVKQAQKLVAECCDKRPGIETAHIVGVIHSKAAQPRGRKPNSLYAAVFATEVPEFIANDQQFYAFLQNPDAGGNGSQADDPDLSPRERRWRTTVAKLMERDDIPRWSK